MKFTIDNNPTSTDLVSYNDGMGFGQFRDPDLIIYEYAIEIDKHQYIDDFKDKYWSCVTEIKIDDELNNDDSVFTPTGYKSLDKMSEHPIEFAEAIDDFLGLDTLGKYVGYKKDTFDYVINSIDKVEIIEDKIIFVGRCFKRHVINGEIIENTTNTEREWWEFWK